MMTADYTDRAAANGLTASREAMSHAALWHNIQVPQFGRLCELIFGGQVAALPNHAVYAACQAAAKRAKGKVTLRCVTPATPAGSTVYEVAGVLVTVDE